MLCLKAALILGVSYAIVLAQPSIDLGGVRNAASLMPPGLPGSSIAPGSIFVVFGQNIGPATPASATLPFQVTLAGSSLNVTVGGTKISPLIMSARRDEIRALLPSQTPIGAGTVSVVYEDQTSEPRPIMIAQIAVGIYTTNGAGTGPASATDFNHKPIGPLSSAKPGQEIIVSATGTGPIPFDESLQPAAEPLNVQTKIDARIYIGGKMVSPSFVGRASCCSGLDQIIFQLPPDVTIGCDVPVAVYTREVVSNFVTISVAPNGGACSDSAEHWTNDLARLSRQWVSNLGLLEISSITSGPGGTGLAPIVTTNSAEARFVRYDESTVTPTRAFFRTPSPGSCVVVRSSLPDRSLGGHPLDAGSVITLTGPEFFSAQLAKNGAASYSANFQADPFSSIGAYIFTGMGGTDVGPFTANLPVGPALAWTNANQIVTVHQSAGHLITWTGGDPNGNLQITGSSGPSFEPPFASAGFICTAETSAASFVIPSTVLLALPASSAGPGSLTVSSQGPAQRFSIPGLDLGVGMTIDEIRQNVIYKQ
jgi:uncharacterized protein (TIGR03437 family)